MSTKAKATLAASIVISVFTIWAVHNQQNQERADMFQGVLRDEERRKEKMRQRQQDLDESQRKRDIYARTQNVVPGDGQ